MAIELKNRVIRLVLAEAGKEYRGSRFDWCGQILEVHFKNKYQFCGREREEESPIPETLGMGLHNEFGTDKALGFEDCPPGGFFLKIGLGRMKKDYQGPFDFYRPHQIDPLPVQVERGENQVTFLQQSPLLNGYAYSYRKSIQLMEQGFQVNYLLENRGEKTMDTDEYVHNFLNFSERKTGPDYCLNFPVLVDSSSCFKILNPGDCMKIADRSITWNRCPESDFYLGGLNAQNLPDRWELEHKSLGIALEEHCHFSVSKMKLWGNAHAISPELFKSIRIEPGESEQWSRSYRIREK